MTDLPQDSPEAVASSFAHYVGQLIRWGGAEWRHVFHDGPDPGPVPTPTGSPAPAPPVPPTPPAPGPGGVQVVAWINTSPDLTNADAAKIVEALNLQQAHVATGWARAGVAPVTHVFAGTDPSHVPAGAWPMYWLANPDVANALGYHDRDPKGRPYGKVFTEPTLAHGGSVLTGANSVSVTSSHEGCEIEGDPSTAVVVVAPDGRRFARELCDSVEAEAYAVTLHDGSQVYVSNYVLPPYFGEGAGPTNAMGSSLAPWGIDPGGYAIIDDQAVFAEGYPEWKRALKAFPASRTARRGAVV